MLTGTILLTSEKLAKSGTVASLIERQLLTNSVCCGSYQCKAHVISIVPNFGQKLHGSATMEKARECATFTYFCNAGHLDNHDKDHS